MARVLLLVHRIPYPPNKGDKVRSFHLMQHLARSHQVHLGTFVDDPEDFQHVRQLPQWCADVHAVPLNPRSARVASLAGLFTGEALTDRYYASRSMSDWVDRTLAEHRIDACIVFSSSMAQYVMRHPHQRMLVDFVDVDSAKWTEYAGRHRWPLSWVYAREGRALLDLERRIAARAERSFFVTDQECALFRSLAPECSARVETVCNGVDSEFYAPDPRLPSPFGSAGPTVVFTGAMDYWPNVDAVQWVAQEMVPRWLQMQPSLNFWIVGRQPTAAVRALATEHVHVTGSVPDVRPYIQHASVVVAPLRLARGIQNKVLEAMSMGKAVVTTPQCAAAVGAVIEKDLFAAADLDGFVHTVDRLLGAPDECARVGDSARGHVLESYSWHAHLERISRRLAVRDAAPQGAVPAPTGQEAAA